MNQILITQKLYVTPELKRKQKGYKIKFFVSVMIICILFGYYIYTENDKNKSEAVSKYILAQMNEENTQDSTVRNVVNDVLIVSLDATSSNAEVKKAETAVAKQNESKYTANDGESYTTDAVLKIPSLGIDYPVLSTTSDALLKISLNKYWGPKPNTIGNYCIVGHNYGNGKMFGKLYQMQIGDTAILTDLNNTSVTYEAYKIDIIESTDVACTSQLTGGKREITLITCSNYGMQRRVIKCREI